MLDLNKYGIAERWPRLRRLEEEVAELERRRGEAEGEVAAARNAIQAARERDAEAAGKAARAGKALPKPEHEARAQAALEDAERNLEAYQRAVVEAQGDLAAFIARHRAELHADTLSALRDKAQRLGELMREAAPLYATIADSRYDLKTLAPPTPPDENAPAVRNSFELIGVLSTHGGGPNRGDVEQTFAHLASLEAQFVEPGADNAA